jgi:uncharacterized protein (TIGR00369 family)
MSVAAGTLKRRPGKIKAARHLRISIPPCRSAYPARLAHRILTKNDEPLLLYTGHMAASDPHPMDPAVEARVRHSFTHQEFMSTLGATLTHVEPGRAVVEVVPERSLTQQNGFLHAGVLASMADSACGYAAYTLMPEGSDVLSIEFKLNLLRPASGDLVIADARVVRAGRTVTVCSADIFAVTGDESRQVAMLTGTMMRVPARR